MSDPRRLLDDPQLGLQEREALRAARHESMPAAQRDQLWAILSATPLAPADSPLAGPSSPASSPPAPAAPPGPAVGTDLGAPAAGAKLAGTLGASAGAKTGASAAGAKLAGAGFLGVWKAAMIGAGVMATALGAHSYLVAPALPAASIAAPAASPERAPGHPPLPASPRAGDSPAASPSPTAPAASESPAAASPGGSFSAVARVSGAIGAIGAIGATGPTGPTGAGAASQPAAGPLPVVAERTEEPPGSRPGSEPPAGAGAGAESPGAALAEPGAPGASVNPDIGARARAESQLVGQARQQLRGGNPTGALALLDEAQRSFGAGVLGQEREAIAIESLWLSGQQAAAQARARAFVEAYPAGLYSARLRELTRIGEK